MAYSTDQEWLFEKVCHLRGVEKFTFDAIAKRITSEDLSQLEPKEITKITHLASDWQWRPYFRLLKKQGV